MNTELFDRSQEIKKFDDSKLGVKGLVDSGITSIPQIFVHPPETLAGVGSKSTTKHKPDIIPIIDLSGADSDLLRPTIVEKIARASRELGLFQVINHGIELEAFDRMLGATRAFHEQPAEMKTPLYHRDVDQDIILISNIDLLYSKAASWRDTLRLKLGPKLPEKLPEICRNEILEWNQLVTQVGELVMGLLCEGLGIETDRMKEMGLLEGRLMAAQYYPFCPQHNLTMGVAPHTDYGVLTVLLQDQTGGLQIKYGEDWVDVKPVPGALVINIADMLQIMSNDEYKSAEHRVLANSSNEPRISVGIFFEPSKKDNLYEPFPELISQEKPARFQPVKFSEHWTRFFSKELGERSVMDSYRLPVEKKD
ncbi:1-aminocyclopropane-1-carboxylate oxidase-like 1-like [Melia azedarach]|uniref:1-aminocyclopropane-1-carboxylate oxidase-like 1-like n=1 Tax=Melia azedarach TaxID=155640 RepID=A0ACC1XFY7_MELAZ|nr:1-aminocyclopropane-1-carboxylate oxidase-like 1-like [Melia azedarach]